MAVASLGVLAAACTSGRAAIPTDQDTTTPPQIVTVPQTNTDDTDDTSRSGTAVTTCARTDLTSAGNIQRADLNETSGLAVSRVHRDTVWAINDSGNADGVHALDLTGIDQGFFALVDPAGVPVATTDVEDLGFLGGLLYIADIGDNNAVRDTVTILVVSEPAPGAGGTAVVDQELIVQYQTGSVDAEAFLVDPLTGQLVILDKDLSGTTTTVFTIDPPFTDEPMEAVPAGSFDLGLLESTNMELTAAALLFPAAVTAADITADGGLLAVRTYGTVWLFPRLADQSVAEALMGTPCEPGAAREGQGESLAFLPDTGGNNNDNNDNNSDNDSEVQFVTVSEGDFRPLNIATVDVQRGEGG